VKIALLFICLLSLIFAPAPVHGTILETQLQHYFRNGAVAAELHGRPLASINVDESFIPASTLKIATSLLAIRTLGENYHFSTRLLEKDGLLFIQGGGDPFLVSESIERLAALLKQKGKQHFTSLVLDDNRFEVTGEGYTGESSNPYDAINGALAVNFNTVYVQKSATGVSSAEPQTPTLPLMVELAVQLPYGRQRISLPKNRHSTLRYAGELLEAIFARNGIRVENGWKEGVAPQDAEEILDFEGDRDLLRIIEEMLRYSNNFTANQLFLTCGAAVKGYPATYAKARAVAAAFYAKLGIADSELHFEEGSGLAKDNRVTARAMLRILHLFAPYSRLLPEKSGLRVKSGTLTGVYAYAGYHEGAQSVDPFLIILNQPENTRDAMLDLLRKSYENDAIKEKRKR